MYVHVFVNACVNARIVIKVKSMQLSGIEAIKTQLPVLFRFSSIDFLSFYDLLL